MRTKIGVIGSRETADKIEDVGREFEDQADIFVYKYYDKKETIEILESCQDKVDVLLFSGQIPYSVAMNENKIKKPSVFIPRTGTSLYKAFWYIRDQGLDYRKISFDTIEQKAIEEVAKELGFTIEKLYVKSYPGDIDYNDLVKFHKELWEQNKINVAATCVSGPYRKLKEMGIPVVRLLPTCSLIREYINKAIYKGNVEKIRATQIAVQIIKIKNKNRNMSTEYEFLKLKNKLEEVLIQYTQENFGSIFPFGRDEYLIFSTRGAIGKYCDDFTIQHYIDKGDISDIHLASGIGFGNTVYQAEVNARIALEHATREEYNCTYVVDEAGAITGPITKKNNSLLTFDRIVTSTEDQRVASAIQISAAYVSKIKAIINKIGRNTIEAEELASYLGISVRSSRRILKQIVDANYAAIIASESRTSTGRPRQIYQINL